MKPPRLRIVLLVGVIAVCAFASALPLSLPKPWPLVVIFSDLYRVIGGSEDSYNVVAFLTSFFFLLLALTVGWAIGQVGWLRRRGKTVLAVGFSLSTGLACVAFWAYPSVKAYFAARQIGKSVGQTAIVYLSRNAEYDFPEDRVRALFVTSQQDQPFIFLPPLWPFSLLNPGNSLIVRTSEERLESLFEGVKQDGAFELPEQLDPRPVLDHAAYFVGIARGASFHRAYGRLSDDGCDHLLEVGQGLVQRLDLEKDWWRSVPGEIDLDGKQP